MRVRFANLKTFFKIEPCIRSETEPSVSDLQILHCHISQGASLMCSETPKHFNGVHRNVHNLVVKCSRARGWSFTEDIFISVTITVTPRISLMQTDSVCVSWHRGHRVSKLKLVRVWRHSYNWCHIPKYHICISATATAQWVAVGRAKAVYTFSLKTHSNLKHLRKTRAFSMSSFLFLIVN